MTESCWSAQISVHPFNFKIEHEVLARHVISLNKDFLASLIVKYGHWTCTNEWYITKNVMMWFL